MKVNVTSFEQSIKLKDLGLDQQAGCTYYVAKDIPVLPKSVPYGADTALCAAYSLEQLLSSMNTFVGNFGFPIQVRTQMMRETKERNPKPKTVFIYAYGGVSFLVNGDNPIEMMVDLVEKLIKTYKVEPEQINISLRKYTAE